MMVNEPHRSQIVILSGRVCEQQVLRFAQDDKMHLSRCDKVYLCRLNKVYLCHDLAGHDAGSHSRCVSSRNN
jgi:hypothetical protein